ncbi:unnamed protein product [Thlaspi arvense]|uniref:Disease resistance protein n=1 Tax=Thlaspi arvense TaxID=13288 RepID=A0AAU9RTJ3_THLAR|nr:unnamed protein product [Thlaspi arvense]
MDKIVIVDDTFISWFRKRVMAETLLSFGVQQLWNLLVRETNRFNGVDEQITELKSDINLLRSFLKDAETKQHASALVRNCVEEIKEIVFDTEDIIETFILHEELKKTSGVRRRMRKISRTVVDRWVVASEMEGIRKRISKVIRDMQSFGVQQVIIDGGETLHSLQERQREMRHSFPSDNESNFVGLEPNVKKLVGYLVNEDSIQVACICGMGGIGKSTLARQVFNHEMVKNFFDGVVWVCVSQHFTRQYVWGTILQKLSSEYDEERVASMTEDELQENIFRSLEASNYLIVLDDMWKEEDWDRIKKVFPPTKGWKILLTSRNEGVALHVDPRCIIVKPECLTVEESWTLFKVIAFPRKGTTELKVDEMEEMGRQMIQQTGGLPLAVKVLGGILASQKTLLEWKRVYQNISSRIVGGTSFNDRNISSVYHVLHLSFEELPAYLKHCFLYLAHFPEDDPIDVEELSYYWAAEGIPRPRYYDGATIRDVGDGYIEELVKRNMVIAERDAGTSRFETCQLHDMMREVCLREAEDENFLQIFQERRSTVASVANSQSPFRPRRVVIPEWFPTFRLENPKVRSLLCSTGAKKKYFLRHGYKKMDSGFSFKKLELIRVLDLSWVWFDGLQLPSGIGKLIHLRYLSLFQSTIRFLPSSMRNLKLLIYLNLAGTFSTHVVNMLTFLKEMRELVYLCLPGSMHQKEKLELTNLVNLETLENFSTEHGSLSDLQGMTRLRALSIHIKGQGFTMEALISSLRELRHLEHLSVTDWCKANASTNEIVLDYINLKQLKLVIYMPRLLVDQQLPSHLTTITLSHCRFETDPMPILEKLLHLKEVSLCSQSFCGMRMVCSSGGFPRLQKLTLWGLEELEEWIVEEGSMPLLHSLEIWSCKKLKEVPEGLRFITSLKDLSCHGMGEEWKVRLSEGGEDYYKVQRIPSVRYVEKVHIEKTRLWAM